MSWSTDYAGIQAEIDAASFGQIKHLPKILTVGPAGSGKSSIFNYIFLSEQTHLFERDSTAQTNYDSVPRYERHETSPNNLRQENSTNNISMDNSTKQDGIDNSTNNIRIDNSTDIVLKKAAPKYVRQDFICNSALLQLSNISVRACVDLTNRNFNVNRLLKNTNILLYIIDASNTMNIDIVYIARLVRRVLKVNPTIQVDVFLHKADLLSSQMKGELGTTLSKQDKEMLIRHKVNYSKTRYYFTSIKDNSIYEAYSRILIDLIPNNIIINNLLQAFSLRCSIEFAFIFDVNTYLCVAKNNNPLDFNAFSTCVQSLKFANCMASYKNCNFSSFENPAEECKDEKTQPADGDSEDDFSPNYMFIDMEGQYFVYLMEVDRSLFSITFVEKQSKTLVHTIQNNLRHLSLVIRKALPVLVNKHPNKYTTVHTSDITGSDISLFKINTSNFNL